MNTRDRFWTLRGKASGLAAAALAPALMMAAPLGSAAQDEAQALTLRSYPLAIHQGTCDSVVTEPSYELGYIVPRALYVNQGDVFADNDVYNTGIYDPYVYGDFYAPDATESLDSGLLENEIVEDNANYLFDDINDDGYNDYGFDVDGDGVLERAEMVERPVIWAYENELNDISPDLLDDEGLLGDDEDPDLDDLRAIPHVLMVHRGDFFDTDYMACGEITGPEDDDGWMVFAVRPVAEQSFVGIGRFEEDEAGFLGIGGEGGAANVYLMPSATANAVGQTPSADE